MSEVWTYTEEQIVVMFADHGVPIIAQILDDRHTHSAVRKKAERMGVSVKKKSEISVADLSQVAIDTLRKRGSTMLCPMCGKRFVAVKSTGLCCVCHKHELTDAHNAAYAELVANQDYNAAKQRLSRKRKELKVKAPRARGGDPERERLAVNE